MCITVGAAKLSNTVVYAAERTYQGRTVHVLGYQNKAENFMRGKNAMILPIPAKTLGSENSLDMSAHKDLLKSYQDVISPPRATRSFLLGNSGVLNNSRGIEVSVFKTGAYTIVVANEPRVLPEVVRSVDETIHIDPQLMDEYSKAYEGWRVAVCLFEQRIEAEPLLFHYEPLYPEHLFVPTLDAHDGKGPKPWADLDHTVVFGAERHGTPVHWRGGKAPTDDVAPLFADRVLGFSLKGPQANGDYWLRTDFAKTLNPAFAEGAALHLPAGVRP